MIVRISGSLGKVKEVLLLLFVAASVCALIFAGCSKEKSQPGKAGTEPAGLACTVYDKLPGDIAEKLSVNFADRVSLLGITPGKKSPDKVEVSYYWQLKDDLGKFTNVFVHFADSSNNVLFQNDHVFCPKHPFGELKGKFVKETYIVDIPETAKNKEVSIKLGLYVPEPGGPRLKIISSAGAALDEKDTRASVGKIKL